jgi:ABC-2 type transport system ATP-binding protein
MSGLDPFGRRDVREIILEQRELGATVLFSSHILPDAEMLCDRAAIVLNGHLQRVVSLGELMSGGTRQWEVRLEGSPLFEIPGAWTGHVACSQRPGGTVLTVGGVDRVQQVLGWLAERGTRVLAVTPQRGSLEDLFMATAAGGEASAGGSEPAERRSA